MKTAKLANIADIQTGPFGSQLHKEDYVDAGTPIVTVEHLGRRKLSNKNVPFVSESDAHRLSKYSLEQGDIVFSRVGSVDRCSQVSENEAGWLFSGRCLRVRPNDSMIDPDYLYYFLTLPKTQEFIRAIAVGATMPSINTSLLGEVDIDLPPLSEQVGIAKGLGALDDKISTNVRIINATDSLVDVLYSRVSKMPTEQSFAEVAQVFGGSTPSTKNDAFWDGDINWATPTDITALDGPWIGDTSRKITEAGLASMSSSLHPENSILLTSRATIGAIALASGPIATNQGFIVVEAPDELTPWLFAQMKARKREFEAWANGATFMELSRGNFKKLPFIGCSDDDLQAFNDAAWPLLKRAQAAQKETEVLARTRDELLPLLMSGRITVGEAENAADEAASES